MKVFVFDLLPYAEHLEHLKQGKELPYPLPRRHFKPEVAVRTYEEHLTAWQEMDRLGFDGVGFNELGDNPNASTALVQIINQKPRVVWPRDAAETAFVFPRPKK